ncbi:MAG TPA: MMPL family transporter [Mycobacterium sp.]
MLWTRLAASVTGRRSWLIALAVALLGGAVMGLAGANAAGTQSPESLPGTAESARADAVGGDRSAAILVVTRHDGQVLTAGDLAAVGQARDRMLHTTGTAVPPIPVMTSQDHKAAVATVPLSAGLSGFALSDAVEALRNAAADGLPAALSAHVTGGPAFGADIANSFTGANVTLLIVTALVVAILLIVTYRSPVLWLVPLAVIGFADRVATSVGTAVADATGLTFDGSTSGITSVLVFGAGTNYALLLISRYREELRRNADHRTALRDAVRAAGPAIVASNATVVLALLTLMLAVIPSTRSLGVLAACGLVVAALFVVLVLPPLLALFGKRLFWPFVPKPDSADTTETGPWHRVAAAVAHRPALIGGAAIVVLVALSTSLLSADIGLSQTDQFRVKADSVTGFDTLAKHFPGGLSDPTTVVADSGRDAAVAQAIHATPGVVSARTSGQAGGQTRWTVVIDAAPASEQAFETVTALRHSVHAADAGSLVGGPDARALDIRDAAARDRRLVIPAILVVVLVVMYVLLRAVLAPPVLVAATVLSALAALGLGNWASRHVFGFDALDNSTPLFAFLFLVALGVDYTIFLVTRAREETAGHGTRDGMVRAVSATGGVITSAGIVLAAVFCVLGVLPLIVLTQLGIIVGLGILLDTFVVRTLVIPALFALIGPAVWWPSEVTAAPAAGAP